MKKFLTLLFLCSLCVSVLPGCGDSGENEVAEADDAALAADKAYEEEMANFGKEGGYAK